MKDMNHDFLKQSTCDDRIWAITCELYLLTCRITETQINLHIRAVWTELRCLHKELYILWIQKCAPIRFRSGYIITKTCLYNVDPLKPHFYIVKLGFTGVYITFLFLLKNIDCGYSLEPPRRGGSNEYPQSMFLSRNRKVMFWAETIYVLSRNMKTIRIFFSENFHFFCDKIFSIFE